MHKLRENAEKELKMIEEKGISSSNIDNAYKLTEIIKGIDKIEMMQDGGEYSRDRYSRDREDYSRDGRGYSRDGDYSRDDYENGNSYRRGRSRTTGRYVSRDSGSSLAGDNDRMEKYREMKREYSQARDNGSKNRMLDALDDYVGDTCDMIMQICKDSDCVEERNVMMPHIERLYHYLKDR